jgi:hypothetical protein
MGYFFLSHAETFEKRSILFKIKEGENFNHRNTLSILRINPPKFGGGLKFEPDDGIGRKGAFCKGLTLNIRAETSLAYCRLNPEKPRFLFRGLSL